MSGKATTELMEKLHGKIAADMLKRLEDGDCEAKDWAVIVKFLKDNAIDTVGDQSGDADDAFAQLVQAAQKQVNRASADLN